MIGEEMARRDIRQAPSSAGIHASGGGVAAGYSASRMGNGFIVYRQPESAPDGLVVVRKRRLVAAVNDVALRAGAKSHLHRADGRKILGRDYLDGQRKVCVPVPLLIRGLDGLRDIER